MKRLLTILIVLACLPGIAIIAGEPSERVCSFVVQNRTDSIMTVAITSEDDPLSSMLGAEVLPRTVMRLGVLPTGKYQCHVFADSKAHKMFPFEITEKQTAKCRQPDEGDGECILLEITPKGLGI